MLHPQTPPTTGYKVTCKVVANDCVNTESDHPQTPCVIGDPAHLRCCRIGDLIMKVYGSSVSEAEAKEDFQQFLWACGYDTVIVSCEPIV